MELEGESGIWLCLPQCTSGGGLAWWDIALSLGRVEGNPAERSAWTTALGSAPSEGIRFPRSAAPLFNEVSRYVLHLLRLLLFFSL